MTTLQLNSELLRQMSYIVDDDNMLRKVIAYIKKLRKQSTSNNDGALSSSPDESLEKEARQMYGLFQSNDLSDEELSSIVADARKAVYGEK